LTAPESPALSFSRGFAQANLELAKWVAIVTMAIDHYGKIVDTSLYLPTHTIGRVSFPLFAAIIGIRLAMRPSADMRYLRHLVPWAIVSQPVYVLAGRAWLDGNILFTLALGVAVTALLRYRANVTPWALGGGLVVILLLSTFVEYGTLGVLMIPAMAVLVARQGEAGVAAAGPLGVAANANAAVPPLALPDTAALLATPVLMLSTRVKLHLPRLPTQAFYGFYPAHLLALHFYDLYRWSG
jgi:hypothetical protein